MFRLRNVMSVGNKANTQRHLEVGRGVLVQLFSNYDTF